MKNLKAELNSIYGKVTNEEVKVDMNSSYPATYQQIMKRFRSKNKFIYLGSAMACLTIKLKKEIDDIPSTVIIKENKFYAEDSSMERFDYVRYLVKAINNADKISWTMDTDDLLNYLNRAVEIIEETYGEELDTQKDLLLFKVNVLNMTALHRKGKIK